MTLSERAWNNLKKWRSIGMCDLCDKENTQIYIELSSTFGRCKKCWIGYNDAVTPSKTSQASHYWVRFPEPCGCGFIDEAKSGTNKYRKPVLCVIEQGTFFYCPGCGSIETFPHEGRE